MNPSSIIAKIERYTGIFPTNALLEAVSNRDLIIPELLKIIKNTADEADQILGDESYLGHIFAMFLLAQFRVKEALRPLMDLFSLPEEITWDLTGDIVTEDLGRILASVSRANIEPIKEIIENRSNESLFRAAGIDALLSLVVAGEISREIVIDYFKTLYRTGLEREHSLIWDHLVVSSVNLYPEELMDDIHTAFELSLADTEFISPDQVNDALQSGKERVLSWLSRNPSYQLIDDAIFEVKKWLPVEQGTD